MDRKEAATGIWDSFVALETYIQRGIVEQLRHNPPSFGGDDMKPVFDAYDTLRRLGPALPEDLHHNCKKVISVAEKDLNQFIKALEQALVARNAGMSDAEALKVPMQTLQTALEHYREALKPVTTGLFAIPSEQPPARFHFAGPIYGPMNVAGGDIKARDINPTRLEVSISSVASAIEASRAPESEKAEAKSRLQAFLSHPLVDTVVGQLVGAAAKGVPGLG